MRLVATTAAILWLAAAGSSTASPAAVSPSAAEHQQRGRAYLGQGNLPAALVEFRAAVALRPDDAVSRDQIGAILAESGRLEEALAEFREAVRIDPQLAPARAHLARAWHFAGRADEAIAEYQMALYLDPSLLEAADGLSGVCASLGDLEGAVRMLKRVVENRSSYAEARYNLGLNLWNRYRTAAGPPRKSDLEEAVRELEEARRLAPAQARIHATLGQLLTERQSLDAAVASLKRAVELAPGDATHAYDLGLALRRQGNLDAAEAQFRVTLAADPTHGQARRALGLVLRQKDDLQGATAELRKSVALLPGDAQGHNVLGTVLLRLGDLRGAIEAFRQATRLDSSLTEARVNLAQALVKAGRKDEARKEAAEVERLKAEEAGLGRAMLLVETAAGQWAKGQLAGAVSQLREATAASPSFAEAHYQLGLALRRSGVDPREAQMPFLRVLQLEPGHAPARYEMAKILVELGETDSAVLQLRKAVEQRPSLAEARRELARLAARSHDWATAVYELQAALVWEPGHREALRDLEAALEASSGAKSRQQW
jgi:tetratricopeptide (TPR) repeat protein